MRRVINHGIFLFCRYSIILYNDPTWLTSILCILAVGALLLCDDPLSGKYGTYSFFVNLLLIRYAVNQFSYVCTKNFARSKVPFPNCFSLKLVLCCLLFFIDKIIYIEIAKKENESWFKFVPFASH